MSVKKFLIIGLGYLGTKVAEILKANQYSELYPKLLPNIIAGINRNFYNYQFDIIQTPQDITEKFILQANWDYIIFCVSPNSYTELDYKKIYLDGLNKILINLENNNLLNTKFLLVTSTAVYNDKQNFNAKILLDSEQLLLNSQLKHKIILRLGGIYGDSRISLINKILTEQPVLLDIEKHTNRINITDAARLILFLLNKNLSNNKTNIYNGVDGQPLENNWLCQQLAELFAVKLNSTITTASARQKTSNKQISNQDVLDLGFKFIYNNYLDYCKEYKLKLSQK